MTLPLLILHGTDDRATLSASSRYLRATAGSRDRTLELCEGHHRVLLNDVGEEAAFADTRAWLDARAA